jgi:hypothetical protein
MVHEQAGDVHIGGKIEKKNFKPFLGCLGKSTPEKTIPPKKLGFDPALVS